MALDPISGLPVAISVDGSEYYAIVQGGTTKRVTISNSMINASLQLQAALNALTQTQGSILYRNATEWTYLAPGTNGYVLTTSGTGGNPYWAAGGGASGITIGTSTITSGTNTRVLYDNAGVVGEYAISGTGSVAMTNSPTLVTPALGTPSAGVLTNCTGLPLSTGVTGNLPVANLNSGSGASSSTFWRGDGTWATVLTGLTVGTTAIASGTTTRVLYDNAGTLGEYTISGTGSVAMTTSPTFTTPALGTPSAAVLTNATGLPLTSGVTGVLPVANGGTNASSASITAFNNITGYTAAGATGTTSTNLVFSTSPTLVTPILGTPTSGTLTNCTGLPLSTGVTGNLSVNNLNGGSGASSSTFWRGDGTWATVLTGLTVGTTAIASGTTLRLLYDSAGTLSETAGITYTATGQLTLAGGTVTANTPALDITQTWNSAGTTFTALNLNITNTASAAGSLFLNFQVGGTTSIAMRKDGAISSSVAAGYANATYRFSAGNFYNTGFGSGSYDMIHAMSHNGGTYFAMDHTALAGGAGWVIGWQSAAVGSIGNSVAYDTGLKRAAAKVVSIEAASSAGGTIRFIALSPSQITANQNDYNPGGTSYFQRWNTDASRNITGMTFTATQVDGQTHCIINVGSQNIVLVNESASSTAANRFTNNTGADITLAANAIADLIYDGTSSRWRVSKRA